MHITATLLAGAIAVAGLAAPAAAQTPYPYYPQGQAYPPQSYPQQAYPQTGYAQPYGQAQGGLMGVINQLLGNRYNAPDRTAVSQCAAAAQAQVSAQYRPGYGQYQQGYGQSPYGYGQNAYGQAGMAQVTAITNVERRRNGLRVTGLMRSAGATPYGYGQQPYGQAYSQPYGNAYGNTAAGSDLTFRCNVDYRGAVTNLRVTRNNAVYRR